MKALRQTAFVLLSYLLIESVATASTPGNLEVFAAKSRIVNKEYKSVIPIEIWRRKIFLNAAVNGKTYRFILDTGSPTILTKKVAEALKLEVRGQNKGKDANGNLVEMDLSVLNELIIGDVEFRNIPVFIFDPSNLALGEQILDGGIIGSEIMPLSNWQINFEKKQLILTDDTSKLEFISKADKAKLQIYGYPYMPILEHEINGKFKDNALFDTGSSELLHLNDKAFEEIKKRKLVRSTVATAFGTFGESAGGRGQDSRFGLVPLKQLTVGELRFNNIEVWTRPEVPSLIGAKIFESHIVTLDYSNKMVYFHKYRDPVTSHRLIGFKPYLKDGAVYIGFLIEPSPAAKAGLQLHDQIIKINDTDLTQVQDSDQLQVLNWLSSIDEMQKIEITFKSSGLEKRTVIQKK